MTQATAALPYSREDVQRSFDPLSFHRGLRYLREERVQDGSVEVDARGKLILRGRVEGTEVYSLEVRVQLDGHQPRISSACDCPVQLNCKHGVALALHLLNNAREAEHDPGQLARNQLLHWLDETAKATEARHMGGARDELHYLLHGGALDEDARYAVDAAIKVVRTRPRKTGHGYVKPQPVSPGELTNLRARGVMSGEDLEALGLLVLASQSLGPLHAALDAQLGERILRAAAATGRLHWRELDGPLLEWAEARPLRAEWERAGGDYRLQLDTDPRATLLHGPLPLFVDAKAGGCGLLKEYPELNGTQWAQLRSMPAVPEALAAEFGQKLRLKLPQLPLPSPLPLEERHLRDARPEPVLRLRASAGPEGTKRTLDLQFRYGHLSINPRRPDPILAQADGDHLVFVHRALDSEREATERLMALGWRAQASDAEAHRFTPAADTPSTALQIWHRLLEEERPALEAAGWRFIEEAGLGLRFIDADWDAALDEGPDWFDLRFDLDIDGTRVALAPLLAPLVGEWLAVPENLWPDRLAVDLGDGRQVLLDSRRLQPIMRTLDELFQLSGMEGGEALRLPRARAGLLAALDQSRALRGAAELRSMLKGLRDPGVIEPVEPPKGLQATLRPYQLSGLKWLQFLRRARFSGVLADDMGLGKTLQTLAHILVEKEAGRLDRPALIICPTSLLGNWRREAARFTPELSVLTLQGPQRQGLFADIAHQDIVLSTYPLLPRDEDELRAQEWHLLILDEAQQVKNPQSRAARVLRRLNARHRLCLTGTPMENHLGELWTQFDFLMPGLLGDLPRFNNRFRRPIEQGGDPEVHAQLVELVRPFMLRRTKSQVAPELPPRTDIVHGITLEAEQAQLYESVRVSMDHKVREAIAQQGLERSQITILDALLKLRQVCCDPALLKLDAARRVQASAKRERLRELLPEMLEEGRRVLLFSQFTQMLELIEEDLDALGLSWTKLTGQTRERDAVIERFRSGEVNLFLISLKAGGVGLNLVEADTVILYDPWWNPAVEEQAADRAHRIGQNKPVFVHRLVVENSVEERMLQLQQRKEQLAKGIYAAANGSQKSEQISPFDPGTLAELMAPLSID